MDVDELIRRTVYQIKPVLYITTPICGDCEYSRYPRFVKGNVICTALGNKNTVDVFNTPECREVFKNQNNPHIKLER